MILHASVSTVITVQHIILALIATAGPVLTAWWGSRRQMDLRLELNGKLETALRAMEARLIEDLSKQLLEQAGTEAALSPVPAGAESVAPATSPRAAPKRSARRK